MTDERYLVMFAEAIERSAEARAESMRRYAELYSGEWLEPVVATPTTFAAANEYFAQAQQVPRRVFATTLAAAAGHPVQCEPHLPSDAVWVIDGQHYAGPRAYRALTGRDPTSAAATPPPAPEPQSEWCCGGTCLRVNCEYHGPDAK